MSGKLITNQETTLSDLFKNILPKTNNICFLVGYFYFSGFPEFYRNIKDKNMRILVGLDIDVTLMNKVREFEQYNQKRISKRKDQQEYYKNFVKLFNNTDFFDSPDAQEAFKIFYEKLKDGTLQIRKTAEPNHAKMYLFEEPSLDPTMPGHMIVGSSNLSIQGLKRRNELNVVFHDVDYNDGKKLFEKLWATATPIADLDNLPEFEKEVISKIWYNKDPSPYLVYLRVLNEYFQLQDDDRSFRTPHNINSHYMDFEYQTDAIKSSLEKIDRHNGVIIADVVGLGKSIIGSAVAANIPMPVVIITPPHLKSQWEEYSQEFGFFHRTHIYTNGKIEDAVKDFSSVNEQILVIIDEAHKYRNQKNKDYQGLHQLCQGNKVVLLTATPYNNRPQDIYSLLKLFQIPGKSTLKNVDNLGNQFDSLIAEYNKIEKIAKKDEKGIDTFNKKAENIAKRILSIISPVVIRRSRKDLEAITRYKKDLDKQGITFPKVCDPQQMEYSLGKLEKLYIDTLDTIYAKENENLDDGEVEIGYKASRYQPLQYVKKEKLEEIKKKIEEQGIEFDFFQRSQRNLANFMRRLLVHRFESSVYSFKISLKSMIDTSKNILNWIEKRKTIPIYKKGDLPDIENLMNFSDEVGNDMLGKSDFDLQLEKLSAKGLFEISIDDIREDYVTDIKGDNEILETIYKKWFSSDNLIKHDPKLDSFSKVLADMLKKDPKRKIVVFTEFADTAEYLEKKLKEAKGMKVFGYSSRKASAENKKTIRYNFDAGVPNNLQENNFDILIATDAISEGYNLHRAGTIFNYDIPYNPTRVVQRIGRINRVNKKVFDELYIYNYFPSIIGEKDVKVKKISTIKMRMIHAIMGGDMKILTGDEELFFSQFNKHFREMEELTEQKSWDADYREEWEQSKKTPEYKKALEICQRTKIGRKSLDKNGIIIFGKRGQESIFKWLGNTEEDSITLLPENALPIFKADILEKGCKLSNSFYDFYNKLKDTLFGKTEGTLSKTRGKAMTKIRAWLSEQILDDEDYLNLLQQVIEIDGLPDYSIITRAKNIESLKKDISMLYLEKIIEASEKIDEAPEHVILAEELQ